MNHHYLRAQDIEIGRLLLIGGGAGNAVWRQILADVLNLPVWLPALNTEATAMGALVAGGGRSIPSLPGCPDWRLFL